MRFRRTVPCKLGGNFEVDLEISLLPGHSLDARTLSGILQSSAGRCFDYALATSHSKTILTALSDGEGRTIGDAVASFRIPAQARGPEGDRIHPLTVGAGA
jgi:hypothetical protein